jgi:hypothetical protein
MQPAIPTPAPNGEFLDTREAEQFARQSYATLKRRHREGHDTGLRKRGRRVLFHVATLRKFLSAEEARSAGN